MPYNETFADDVMFLANGAFGDGYMTQKPKYSEDEGSFKIACIDGKAVGFCQFQYVSAAICSAAIKLPETLLRKNADASGNVCYAKSLVVAEQHRGKNIAKNLFKQCLRDAVEAGLRSVWGSAWKVGESIPMKNIFIDNGFIEYGEVSLVWFDRTDLKCIICNGPCVCNGIVYYKTW